MEMHWVAGGQSIVRFLDGYVLERWVAREKRGSGGDFFSFESLAKKRRRKTEEEEAFARASRGQLGSAFC